MRCEVPGWGRGRWEGGVGGGVSATTFLPGFLSRSCWKWNVAESYSFFLNIKSAIIWDQQKKEDYLQTIHRALATKLAPPARRTLKLILAIMCSFLGPTVRLTYDCCCVVLHIHLQQLNTLLLTSIKIVHSQVQLGQRQHGLQETRETTKSSANQ